MQITAKVIQLLPIQTGKTTTCEWMSQEIIVQTAEAKSSTIFVRVDLQTRTYNGMMTPSIWNDHWYSKVLKIGNHLSIQFRIESKEFNGKFYTSICAEKIKFIED